MKTENSQATPLCLYVIREPEITHGARPDSRDDVSGFSDFLDRRTKAFGGVPNKAAEG